jgi:hypothetical protein
MNVSLLKGSKTLLRGNSAGGGGQRSRRGSQASVASGQIEGTHNGGSEGNNGHANNAGGASSSREGKPRPHRQLSTDTTNTDSTTPNSSRPISKSKYRQDSVASNV